MPSSLQFTDIVFSRPFGKRLRNERKAWAAVGRRAAPSGCLSGVHLFRVDGRSVATHVGPGQLHDLGIGDDPVQDGFRDHGIVQGLVPILGIELAGDCGRASAFTRGEDVEQLGRGLARDRRSS